MEYIIISLLILLGVREYLSFHERKDMLDRLMSRNFGEYKDNTKTEENQFVPEDDGTEDLEVAKDQIMYGQEE